MAVVFGGDVNYYSHHIGDYTTDTAHLSLLEDGAYRRLMDRYYTTEAPLPSDDTLFRLVRARSTDEQEAVRVVLAEFFDLTTAGWTHKRCDKEIEAFKAKSDKAADAANKRWGKSGNPISDVPSNAKAMPTHSERNADAMLTNNQEPITIKEPKTKGAPPALPDWLPLASWNGYLEMRKKIKKPPTDRAITLLLNALEVMRAEGQDIAAVLDKSTMSNWTDVYPLKNAPVSPQKERDWI